MMGIPNRYIYICIHMVWKPLKSKVDAKRLETWEISRKNIIELNILETLFRLREVVRSYGYPYSILNEEPRSSEFPSQYGSWINGIYYSWGKCDISWDTTKGIFTMRIDLTTKLGIYIYTYIFESMMVGCKGWWLQTGFILEHAQTRLYSNFGSQNRAPSYGNSSEENYD